MTNFNLSNILLFYPNPPYLQLSSMQKNGLFWIQIICEDSPKDEMDNYRPDGAFEVERFVDQVTISPNNWHKVQKRKHMALVLGINFCAGRLSLAKFILSSSQ